MASNEEILKEAQYYLENDVTVEEASKDLGISKRTLQLHLLKLENISPETFELVRNKKKSNEQRGKVKGGTLGKRSATWTKEKALSAAEIMINGGLTYEQTSELLSIPTSTLHEMVHKGVTDPEKTSLLYALAEANRRKISVEEYKQKHNSEHVASDQVAKDVIENSISNKKAK